MKWLWHSSEAWGLCGRGHGFNSTGLPNNILHDLWEGMWGPPGLPCGSLSLVHLKCHWPITCRHLWQCDWATCQNIPRIFLGIFFFLTGLYGCLVSILDSLIVSPRRTQSLSFRAILRTFIFEQIFAPNPDSDHSFPLIGFWTHKSWLSDES